MIDKPVESFILKAEYLAEKTHEQEWDDPRLEWEPLSPNYPTIEVDLKYKVHRVKIKERLMMFNRNQLYFYFEWGKSENTDSEKIEIIYNLIRIQDRKRMENETWKLKITWLLMRKYVILFFTNNIPDFGDFAYAAHYDFIWPIDTPSIELIQPK